MFNLRNRDIHDRVHIVPLVASIFAGKSETGQTHIDPQPDRSKMFYKCFTCTITHE